MALKGSTFEVGRVSLDLILPLTFHTLLGRHRHFGLLGLRRWNQAPHDHPPVVFRPISVLP
jgi:hypothetical protein